MAATLPNPYWYTTFSVQSIYVRHKLVSQWKCKTCGLIVLNPRDREFHFYYCHVDKLPFKCRFCKRLFGFPCQYRNHAHLDLNDYVTTCTPSCGMCADSSRGCCFMHCQDIHASPVYGSVTTSAGVSNLPPASATSNGTESIHYLQVRIKTVLLRHIPLAKPHATSNMKTSLCAPEKACCWSRLMFRQPVWKSSSQVTHRLTKRQFQAPTNGVVTSKVV